MRIPFITPLVWGQVLISACIVAVGLVSLSQVDADLQLLYREYTLAAVDLSPYLCRCSSVYRVTIVRAIESANQQEFERLTGSLAMDRARIQHAVDRYAAASLRVSRSGRSEPQDLEVIRQSLDAYFCSASKSITLLVQSWHASTPARRAALQHRQKCMPRIMRGRK